MLNSSDDTSFFSSENDEEVVFNNKNKSNLLYVNSNLTVDEFTVIFLATIDKLALPETHKDIVLDLIRLTMPLINNLPLSFHSMQKTVPVSNIISFSLCNICFQEIQPSLKDGKKNKKCSNDNCPSKVRSFKTNKIIKVSNSDIISQLKLIYNEHKDTILKNKSN
jgi:hypothetical protein